MKKELQNKEQSLGFLRHWKVMTMTLLLLTFSIGQMWGAEETLTWAYSGINTACTDPSGITMSSSNATSTIQSSMAATFSNVKTKSDASSSGYSSRLQATAGTYLGDKNNKQLLADQYVGASFTIPDGYVFKLKSISFPYCAISTGINARLTISDGETDVTPSDGSASSGGTATISYSDATMAKELSGDVTVKIWFWMPGSTRTGKYAGLGDLAITGDLVASGGDPIPVTGITIAPSSATIKVDKTLTLVPTITPSNATDKAVTWAVTSGNTYASVNESGVVTGLAAGEATITATAHDGSGVTQTATVTVEECPTSGTIYKFQLKTDLTNGNLTTSVPQDVVMTTENYLSNLTGGTLTAAARSNVNRINISNGNAIGFANGDQAFLKMDLDCAIQEGDILKYTITSNDMILMAGSETEATNRMTLSRNVTQVEVDSKLVGADALYMKRSSSSPKISYFEVFRPVYRTITLEYADGVTPDGSIEVIDGEAATKPADPTWEHHRFDGWYDGSDPYDWSETVGGDLTLTAHWTQLYTVTYAAGDAGATGDAPTQADKAATETFKVAANTFELAGKVFDHWNDGSADYNPDDTYTVGTSNVTLTAVWRTPSTMYAITEGTHTNGSISIDPVEQEEGEIVTLEATPDEDYLFSAWEVVKTEDGSATGITVDANGQFTMPAYAVTVNATFVSDPRTKVLYISTASAENDKVYEALKDIYNVKVVNDPASTIDQTAYALIVLHESVGGGNYNATAIAAAKSGNVPVLNTKSYFYTSARWNWGTPNAGQKTKGVHVNRAYCNITDHPLFSDLTPDANDSIIILSSINSDNKPIQPLGTFEEGKAGYTLANVPDGCAIHELTPAQRGAESGKYLLISLYSKDFANLNANGQKLFQNAAAYLIGSASWTPVVAPSAAAVEATPSENYTEGNTITLTASATGTSASTTYTWYKGDNWAAASAAPAVQAAATAAADGNVFTKTAAVEDAGTYWCNISNGAGCDAQASVTITVSSASTPTHTITYDNVKGATMTGYPTEYTEGIGVASFAPLADITGWHFVEWSPASIGTDATTDQTITAVWAQVFEVSFDGNGHGDPIAPQNIVDGELATDPGDPSEIGYDFGGWFTDAECTAGNEFDFATPITATTPLFAKWTAFAGCVLLVPATSGEALAVGDEISMQSGSKGGKMHVIGTPLSYNAYGLSFESSSSAKAKVTINSEIQEGTVISLTLVANGTSSPRGLHLYTGDGATKITSLGWTSDMVKYTEETYTYTVQSTDVALIGTNEFQLWRNGSVFLKQLTVTSCGDPIIFHDLTSAILPDNDPAYATVTLGASSVREGYTTTAEYSGINAAYEFDEWQISGTGASIADASANPAVITMGTADAVVTLKLKAATPKHTVTFNKMGKGADVASQEVKEGDLVEEPTVSEPEGWLLEGWYKESTLENKWDFASDVMGTSNIELFANWVADTSIKLLSGSTVNHTDFITGVSAETVEISSVDYDCVKFSGTVSNVNGVKDLTRVIAYNAKTNKTKIQLHLYNTSTSTRTVLVKGVLEGNTSTDDIVDLASITLGNKEEKTTDYIEFNNAANRTIYIFIGSSAGDVRFLQVKVIDDGTTPMKAAGQAGYSLNLNKGRFFGTASTDLAFEGMNVRLSGDYTAMNSGYAKLTSTSMSFTVASAMTLSVTTNNNKTYYVTKGSAGTDNETAKTGVSEFDLTAGTWYITAGSNEVQFTNIAFTAPKCAEPAFNSLANSDICSGDPYVALNGTATVADAGVPTYQWYREDNSAIDGETSATYTPSADGKYYVIAVNHLAGFSDNEKKSALVTVTTHAGTAITTAPANVRKSVGEDATLEVVATGKNLSYVWYTCDDAEGNNPVAINPAETNATLNVMVPDGIQWYKVVVSSDCGADLSAVAKVEKFVALPQLHITGTTNWDLTTCADAEIKLTSTTSPKKGEECLMANIEGVHLDANFNSQALVMSGEYIYRTSVTGNPTCAEYMKFITDVEGVVTVTFAGNGSNRLIRVTGANGVQYSTVSTGTGDTHTEKFYVTPGEVELMGMNSAKTSDKQYMRFFNIAFKAEPDYTRNVTEGRYGTICLPNGGVMVGAALFEVAYHDATLEKIFFDEILNGEMVAGRPYIFLPEEGIGALNVYYTDAANEDAGNYHGLYGSYTQQVLAQEAGNYILYNNQYMYVGESSSNVSVGANRAYFKLAEIPTNAVAPLPGRRRVSMSAVRETPTGLENGELINGENGVQKVLINGELFILRGEKMYDATGRLVK